MSFATIMKSDELNNHEVKKLVEKTFELMKLSIVQSINSTINPQVYKFKPSKITVGGRVQIDYPSAALVVADRIKSLTPEKLNVVRLSLGRDRSITSAIRSRGLDIRSKKSISEQTDLKSIYAFVNETTFSEDSIERMITDMSILSDQNVTPIHDAVVNDLRNIDIRYGRLFPTNWIENISEQLDTGARTAVLNKGVKFRIHKVKCVDETDPEWIGEDKISWGGTTVDDKGAVSKIPETQVGRKFNDGDSKTYRPPKIIKTFPLDNVYPKQFYACLSIAENDWKGMSKFIQELYEATRAEITSILSALGVAAGAVIGSAIGGSVGTTIGGPLGTIIGISAGAIVGCLIDFIANILQDDIFMPQETSLLLNSAIDTFPDGGLISPKMNFLYIDHGGCYRIDYDWEITR